jgi:hypothetical protein
MKGIIEQSAVQSAEGETIKKRLLIRLSEILLLNQFLEFNELLEEAAAE